MSVKKTATLTISRSSDARTAHIGHLFVDFRDTTGGRNIQKAVFTKDVEGALELIGKLEGLARENGVELTVTDESGELGI
jgi:hypothetical protein